MNSEYVSAKINADVSLSANKSQALPLALMGLSAISLVASLFFLAITPERCWLPVVFTIAFASVGVVLWTRSHKVSELDGGNPTEIFDSQRGLRVSTDSRALESPVAVQHLAELLSQVAHRRPLPEPDGMVDGQGNPQPQKKIEAQELVSKINVQAESVVKYMAESIYASGQTISEPTHGGPTHGDSSLVCQNVPLVP